MDPLPYEYAALTNATTSIRVLTIPHSGTYEQTEATCKLEETHLGASSKYVALSYTWAMDKTHDASKSRFLTISGRRLPITQNLHDCICRIRVRKHALRIWIDAVCINQIDAAERTAQVSIMARIYQNAMQTITWLGEYDDLKATEELRCLFLRMSRCRDNFVAYLRAFLAPDDSISTTVWSRLGYVTYSGGKCKLNGDQDGHGNKDWSGSLIKLFQRDPRSLLLVERRLRSVLNLVSRRYWTRRWIVQEMYHSQAMKIYWDHVALDQEQFFLACKYLERVVGFLRSIYVLNPVAKQLLVNLRDILESDELSHLINLKLHLRDAFATGGFRNFKGRDDQLPWLLDRCQGMDCQDPRDRLFALISMFQRPIMRPDYELTTVAVFVESARKICAIRAGGQWIVQHWQTRSYAMTFPTDALEHALPSWVPDFRRPIPGTILNRDVPWVPDFIVNDDNSVSFRARVLGTLTHLDQNDCPAIVLETFKSLVVPYHGPGGNGDIVCAIGTNWRREYVWLLALQRIVGEPELTFKISGLIKMVDSLELEPERCGQSTQVVEQNLLETMKNSALRAFRVV